MQIVDYECEEFDPVVRKWWGQRQDLDFPLEILPPTGLMAMKEDRKVAALFIYETNSLVAILGWPISDPESSKDERDVALDMLFKAAHEKLTNRGFLKIWTTSGVPALQDRMEELGYVVGDKNINQYWKDL